MLEREGLSEENAEFRTRLSSVCHVYTSGKILQGRKGVNNLLLLLDLR